MEENKAQTNDYAYYHGSVKKMSQVDTCLDQLITAVLESDEYRRYQEIKEKIKLEPEKEQAIHNFRRQNFLLQSSKNDVDLFEEIDRLEREFAVFRAQPLVEDYLAAELAFCRLIQKINWKLMEHVEFDIGFHDQ